MESRQDKQSKKQPNQQFLNLTPNPNPNKEEVKEDQLETGSYTYSQVQISITKQGRVIKVLKAPPIENIAIKGAGMRGIGYLGALKALYERQLIQNVKRVVGTSAGSLVAMILALGFSYDEICKEFAKVDFNTLVDGKKLKEYNLLLNNLQAKANAFFQKEEKPLITNVDLISSEKLYDLIKSIIKDRLLNIFETHGYTQFAQSLNLDKITFKDLKQLSEEYPLAGLKELMVTGVRLTKDDTGVIEYFNADKTPDMEVATAVRISVSIPYFFKPVEHNGHLYIDGGCLDNFPIGQFDDAPILTKGVIKKRGGLGQNLLSIGIGMERTENLSRIQHDRNEVMKQRNHWKARLKGKAKDAITGCESTAAEEIMLKHAHHKYAQRIILLDDKGTSMTDFDMSESTKDDLIHDAEIRTNQWLDTYLAEDSIMEYQEYDSFEAMCSDMEFEELTNFCDLCANNPALVFTDPNTDASFINMCILIAHRHLQNKQVQQKSSANDLLLDIYHRILLELAEPVVANSNNEPALTFRTQYLAATLDMVEHLRQTNLPSLEKARLLMAWAWPALNSPQYETLKADLLEAIKEFGIAANDIEDSYVISLYQLREQRYLTSKDAKLSDDNKLEYKQSIDHLIADKIKTRRKELTQSVDRQSDKKAESQISVDMENPNAAHDTNASSKHAIVSFGDHLKRIQDDLKNKYSLVKFEVELKKLVKDAIRLIEDTGANIIVERYQWSHESLYTLLQTHLTFKTKSGISSAESKTINDLISDTAHQIHIAYESHALRLACHNKITTYTQGLELVTLKAPSTKLSVLPTESQPGTPQEAFDKAIKSYAVNRDEQSRKVVVSTFSKLVQANPGKYTNLPKLESELADKLNDWPLLKNLMTLASDAVNKMALTLPVSPLNPQRTFSSLFITNSNTIKVNLPSVNNNDKTPNLEYQYQLIALLESLRSSKIESDKKDFMSILQSLPVESIIKEFFTRVSAYDKQPDVTQRNAIDTYLKSKLNNTTTLSKHDRLIVEYFEAFYRTYIKVDDQSSNDMKFADVLVLNASTHALVSAKHPLSYYLQYQFNERFLSKEYRPAPKVKASPYEGHKNRIDKAPKVVEAPKTVKNPKAVEAPKIVKNPKAVEAPNTKVVLVSQASQVKLLWQGIEHLCPQSAVALADLYFKSLEADPITEFPFPDGISESASIAFILRGLQLAHRMDHLKVPSLVARLNKILEENKIPCKGSDEYRALIKYLQTATDTVTPIAKAKQLTKSISEIETIDAKLTKMLSELSSKLTIHTADSKLTQQLLTFKSKITDFQHKRHKIGHYVELPLKELEVDYKHLMSSFSEDKNVPIATPDCIKKILTQLNDYLSIRNSLFNCFRNRTLSRAKHVLLTACTDYIKTMPLQSQDNLSELFSRVKWLNLYFESMSIDQDKSLDKLPNNNVLKQIITKYFETGDVDNTSDFGTALKFTSDKQVFVSKYGFWFSSRLDHTIHKALFLLNDEKNFTKETVLKVNSNEKILPAHVVFNNA